MEEGYERPPRGLATFLNDCRAVDRILPAALIAGTLIGSLYLLFLAPPVEFPAPSIFRVKSGESVSQIAVELKEQNMVRSAHVLELLVRALGGDRHVQLGVYFFGGGENALHIAVRLVGGDFELKPVRIAFGEGAEARDIARLLKEKLAPFDSEQFLALALPREGYLYPDTYFFYPGDEPEVVAGAMEHNFETQTAPLMGAIESFKKPQEEVLVMASLLEREASSMQDRRIIAGILWKRLSIDMPLQVDAAFGYVLDKPLTKLTSEDLRADSPYNTYTNKGLPPTPIGNPGVKSIEAAVTPIKTSYFYYLSDRRGTMHYAATYAQHLSNIKTYLR